ncbi:MAG TPA: hypothetical protein DCE18_18920, partial [Syntrophobacteraceae bacterium]|nr:hypothetical protein [Syntrophobacteraceae bacterium]
MATATHLQGHYFEVGETIIISGADDPLYNGQFPITAVNSTAFQFPVPGAPISPDTSIAITAAALETINLIAMARRPNGQTAVIAGSKRRLYRFYALDDADYISRDPADYPPGTPLSQLSYWSDGYYFPGDAVDYPPGTPVRQQQYVDTIDVGFWIVIGSGYSPAGKRWETVSINGYMVFNNSADLPCTYRVEELEVVPMNELREQGISCVGTISEIDGILVCADITELQADQLASWFYTASDPYARYTDSQYLDRTQFRILWGTPAEPRRFAAIYPGSITAGGNVLTLGYPVKGLVPGQEIEIVGAGAPHAGTTSDNLIGTIIFITGTSIVIDAFAGTTVTSAAVEARDAIGSIVGMEDLQDDGSAILKMMPLSNILVIYKDSSVFLGQYLGTANQPFAFTPVRIQKEQSIFYRNTLALVETTNEMYHVYAGRNAFYRFDLTNQQPMMIPRFDACSNIFFDVATLDNTERIFAAENGITHEILFVFGLAEGPDGSAGIWDDQMLLWDYKYDTISTSSLAITSAATIRKPVTGIASGAEEDWFVMGNALGVVLLYGKTNIAQYIPDWNIGTQIFFRRQSNPYSAAKNSYASTLKSGLGGFGNDYSEKDVRALVALLASQSPGSVLTLSLYGTQNADDPVSLLGAKTFTQVVTRNLMPVA